MREFSFIQGPQYRTSAPSRALAVVISGQIGTLPVTGEAAAAFPHLMVIDR
jgi:hypothetical protein